MATQAQRAVMDIKPVEGGDLHLNSEQIILSKKHYENSEKYQKQVIKLYCAGLAATTFTNGLYPSCNPNLS